MPLLPICACAAAMPEAVFRRAYDAITSVTAYKKDHPSNEDITPDSGVKKYPLAKLMKFEAHKHPHQI